MIDKQFQIKMKNKNTFIFSLICLILSSFLHAQNTADINGDGILNVLFIGTSTSIENNYEAFSPNQISTELQSILAADTSISFNINVVAEDIYKMKTALYSIDLRHIDITIL